MINIEKAVEKDRDFVTAFTNEHARAEFIVTRGRKVYPADIESFIARDHIGRCVGLISFEIIGTDCEVISLDALEKHSGIGTQLLDHAKVAAKERGCKRIWLITTNDNLEALRFYQRRGFVISTIHENAIAESRKLKPTIPLIGNFGIQIRDEIEMEIAL
jgi:N-acetylglutamate synthase-like GNAT family acetyltransferase